MFFKLETPHCTNDDLFTAGIVDYMKKQIGDASRQYDNTKELKSMLANMDDVFIVGFFENKEDELFNNYMEASK